MKGGREKILLEKLRREISFYYKKKKGDLSSGTSPPRLNGAPTNYLQKGSKILGIQGDWDKIFKGPARRRGYKKTNGRAFRGGKNFLEKNRDVEPWSERRPPSEEGLSSEGRVLS